MILCCGAAHAAAAQRLDVFGTIGFEGAPGSRLQSPGGFVAQAGVGYELKRSTSLELMVGYHWLGDIYYSYGGQGPNFDSRVRLVPVTLNLTRIFETQLPYPYLTLGVGLYALHYDRIQSEVPNDLNFSPGFNGGFGFIGSPDRFTIRLDARAHVMPPGSEPHRYDLREHGDWTRVLGFAIGVQFP